MHVDTRHVDIVEVSPRDGLQNESVILSTAAKVDLVSRLVTAGAAASKRCRSRIPDSYPRWRTPRTSWRAFHGSRASRMRDSC